MRIRHPWVPKGTAIGVREAARKYDVSWTLIGRWAAADRGAILKAAAFRGDSVLLDEAWLQGRLKGYEPHRDNSNRRHRLGRTLVETALAGPIASGAASASGRTNGHAPAPALASPQQGIVRGRTSPERGGTPSKQGGAPALSTREMFDLFIQSQARDMGGKLNPNTMGSYLWTFFGSERRDGNGHPIALPGRFVSRFPTIPLEHVTDLGQTTTTARNAIKDYLHGLKNMGNGAQHGQPISASGKGLSHRVLTTFYSWLSREQGCKPWIPDMSKMGVGGKRHNAVPIWPEETRELLTYVRAYGEDKSEEGIIVLLAQTGARLSELCTIREECLHDGWVYIWGKPTNSNPSGLRQLCLPDPAYRIAADQVRAFGCLLLHGEPLAGPLEALDPRRRVDMRNLKSAEETAIIHPRPKAAQKIEDMLRYRMKKAGIWQPGKNAHSFRRVYQPEFIKRGGSREFYRLVMGHFNRSDIDDLYNHDRIEEIVAQARMYAPRRFLEEEASQGRFDLELREVELEEDEDVEVDHD